MKLRHIAHARAGDKGDTLGGGVTRSLALDAHGKCMSSILLDLELPEAIELPDE